MLFEQTSLKALKQIQVPFFRSLKIEDADAMDNVTVYHAGTRMDDEGRVLTNGGRVLNVTALAPTFEAARDLAYEACEKIDFEGKTLRRDIGLRALRGREAWD